MRRAPRGVRVLARDPGVSGRLTRLDLQDRVAVAPIEALQDNIGWWPSLGKRRMKEIATHATPDPTLNPNLDPNLSPTLR